jgi:hypothetical protein
MIDHTDQTDPAGQLAGVLPRLERVRAALAALPEDHPVWASVAALLAATAPARVGDAVPEEDDRG